MVSQIFTYYIFLHTFHIFSTWNWNFSTPIHSWIPHLFCRPFSRSGNNHIWSIFQVLSAVSFNLALPPRQKLSSSESRNANLMPTDCGYSPQWQYAAEGRWSWIISCGSPPTGISSITTSCTSTRMSNEFLPYSWSWLTVEQIWDGWSWRRRFLRLRLTVSIVLEDYTFKVTTPLLSNFFLGI